MKAAGTATLPARSTAAYSWSTILIFAASICSLTILSIRAATWYQSTTRFAVMSTQTKTMIPTHYTVISNVFRQSSAGFDSRGYDCFADHLGLLDPSVQGWKKVTDMLSTLNKEADANTVYKLLILGRHGQGYHNLAESKYGSNAWNCYWSMQDGDGDMSWVDALLTETGKEQAATAKAALASEMARGMPEPTSIYVSPLRRAMQTADIMWAPLIKNDTNSDGLLPKVKENWRETIGLHTCDKRSWDYEPSFSDDDQQWTKKVQEAWEQQTSRIARVLAETFNTDASPVISVVAHNGVINSLLEVIGGKRFDLQTGGVVPVLVKAETTEGATLPEVKRVRGNPAPTCSSEALAMYSGLVLQDHLSRGSA